MFHITNITHEGKMSEAFNNARRVEELSEKLRSRLSWSYLLPQMIVKIKSQFVLRIRTKCLQFLTKQKLQLRNSEKQ